MVLKIAKTDEEVGRCFEVMSALRTHLKRDDFLSTVRYMEAEGYRLAYIEVRNTVVTVAGYRISTNLFMGRHLYVDDLVTSANHRSKGFGGRLIKWLREVAIAEGCQYFDLDSGTHRGRSHKFYFENGMTIASYHFSEKLNGA